MAEKFNDIADASEERFAILSGTYKKIVIEYLTALANGKPPAGNFLHENYVFSDEHTTLQKDAILSPELFRGRRCAGTVELFSEGATFGFKISQTIEFEPGFKTRGGKDVRRSKNFEIEKKKKKKKIRYFNFLARLVESVLRIL